MKEFNLTKALMGAPVVTAGGLHPSAVLDTRQYTKGFFTVTWGAGPPWLCDEKGKCTSYANRPDLDLYMREDRAPMHIVCWNEPIRAVTSPSGRQIVGVVFADEGAAEEFASGSHANNGGKIKLKVMVDKWGDSE